MQKKLHQAFSSTMAYKGKAQTSLDAITQMMEDGYKYIAYTRANNKSYFFLAKDPQGLDIVRPAIRSSLIHDYLVKTARLQYADKTNTATIAQRGEVIAGPSHAGGGVDIVNKQTGEHMIEAEGGEIIINAQASKEKCKELSAINQSAGNGIAFDCSKTGPEAQTDKAAKGKSLPVSHSDEAILTSILPANQARVVVDPKTRTLKEDFVEPLLEQIKNAKALPPIYSQDGKWKQAIAYLHFFAGGASDWYITEKEETGTDRFLDHVYGFAVLNGDMQNAEFGYISLMELTRNNVELDFHWTPKTVAEALGENKPISVNTGASQNHRSFLDNLHELDLWVKHEFPKNETRFYRKFTFTEKHAKDGTAREIVDRGVKEGGFQENKNGTFSVIISVKSEDEANIISDLWMTQNPMKKADATETIIIDTEHGGTENPATRNLLIERLINQKGDNPDNYNATQKAFLAQYTGWGGLDITGTGKGKESLTEFYTPDPIIRKMWALAYKFGFKDGMSVLEPACGTGEFLKYVPASSTARGIEISKYSAAIAKILYPQFTIDHMSFEQMFIKQRDSVKARIGDLPKYDLVIGNPPYGDVGGLYMGMGEKTYSKAGNWVEYFITRGLDLCKPGGLLIYIIGTEVANGGIPWLQQGQSKVKEQIAAKADLLDAYRLPNGVFDRTDVVSDIIVLKKK